MYLEDDMLRKDVLDASNHVLRLTLRKLSRFRATLEYRSVRSKLWYISKLLSVIRLTIGSSGRSRSRSFRGRFGNECDRIDSF